MRSKLARLLVITVAATVAATPLATPSISAAQGAPAAAPVGPAGSDVVIRLDAHGRPLLPDAQAIATRGAVLATGDLTFTFNSPVEPWTATELATLQAAAATIYPVVKSIEGPPAFPHPVNVRKSAAIGNGGQYDPSYNEITIGPQGSYLGEWIPVFAHEMVHAFRDDWIFTTSYTYWTYEEGMTRAAEVQIMRQVPQEYSNVYFDESHSYPLDVYYEGENEQAIGSYGGNIWSGYAGSLERYELTGYAWAKALIENPQFLKRFNSVYYAWRQAGKAFVESNLIDFAASVQPAVEGMPFRAWYQQQAALNMRPPAGIFMHSSPSQGTTYLFQRDSGGWERMLGSVPVQWQIYDDANTLLANGSDLTTSYGWINVPTRLLWRDLPPTYVGRIKVVTSAVINGKSISNEYYTPVSGENASCCGGVFGVTPQNTGNVTIASLTQPGISVTVPVVHGVFTAPTLSAVRGRFRISYSRPGGPTYSRQFTKDASDYYVLLAQPDLNLALTDSPDPGWLNKTVVYTATARNNGPNKAHGVTLTFTRPANTVLAGATTSQGTVTIWGDTVVVNFGAINPGRSQTVKMTVKPVARGTILTEVRLVSTEMDPITSNNIRKQTTTIK